MSTLTKFQKEQYREAIRALKKVHAGNDAIASLSNICIDNLNKMLRDPDDRELPKQFEKNLQTLYRALRAIP